MKRGVLRLGVVGVIAVAAACTELVTSPGKCPDYCPGGKIVTVESLLTDAIKGDSAYTGYWVPAEVPWMVAEELPGQLDSRPFFQMAPVSPRTTFKAGDTTTTPLIVDSVTLTLSFTRPDTSAHNVTVEFYRLPTPIDSLSDFATLAPFFVAPIRTVNLDTLLAIPGRRDSVTGDSVIIDTLNRATIAFRFDTTQIPFVPGDSGRTAFGLRITADAPMSVLVTSHNNSNAQGPRLTWYNSIDSVGTIVPHAAQVALTSFDTFVFDPPTAATDSNLVVGGIPAARSLLRVAIPHGIRDSTQIVRATLYLVPVAPAFGTTADSFFVRARRVGADLGSKSPIGTDTFGVNSIALGAGASDTVRLEVTSLMRLWQTDTTIAPAMYLQLFSLDRDSTTSPPSLVGFEGISFARLRFYSTRSPAFRPALRVTYVKRVDFGAP